MSLAEFSPLPFSALPEFPSLIEEFTNTLAGKRAGQSLVSLKVVDGEVRLAAVRTTARSVG